MSIVTAAKHAAAEKARTQTVAEETRVNGLKQTFIRELKRVLSYELDIEQVMIEYDPDVQGWYSAFVSARIDGLLLASRRKPNTGPHSTPELCIKREWGYVHFNDLANLGVVMEMPEPEKKVYPKTNYDLVKECLEMAANHNGDMDKINVGLKQAQIYALLAIADASPAYGS